MLDHEYTSKEVFRKNFWEDWRKVRCEGTFVEVIPYLTLQFSLLCIYFVLFVSLYCVWSSNIILVTVNSG